MLAFLAVLALVIVAGASYLGELRSGVDPTGRAPGQGKPARGGAPEIDRILRVEVREQQGVDVPVDVVETVEVAQLTGPASPNETDARWNVRGTDLGHMVRHDGRLYLAFGDTFGTSKGGDWRGNALAWSEDEDITDGISFDGMLSDPSGAARAIMEPVKIVGIERSLVPTYGVSVGDRLYYHFMSVRWWAQHGQWEANESYLAYSDDDGETWTRSDVRWGGESNFVQVAFVRHSGWVFVFGIPEARFGAVHLARVRPGELLDADAYRYWTGSGWSEEERRAVSIVPPPVGELSVMWSEHHRLWLMTYLDERRNAAMLRAAPTLTGPWSDAVVIASAVDFPQLYSPYLVPGQPDGPAVHWVVSRYGPYNVFLMRTTLTSRTPVR